MNEDGDNNDSDRDNYDALAEWMVDKQGDDGNWTEDQIADVLREHEVIGDNGHINIEKMIDGLKELGLNYDGYDAETWEDILAAYGIVEE